MKSERAKSALVKWGRKHGLLENIPVQEVRDALELAEEDARVRAIKAFRETCAFYEENSGSMCGFNNGKCPQKCSGITRFLKNYDLE